MKKCLLFFILCVSVHICNGQNWQCLQAGVKHYFINGNGYLRGIRIDSVISLGDTTVYYPNHTPRGPYNTSTSPVLDSNGGSWLGKKVQQLADGTFIFDSYWNDSVTLKTHANIGDSWIFYRDTSSLYYKATLLSKDTMIVLSSPDSVETIMINAYNGSGIITTDPVDSFKIILSKSHGFVQVFDLYTFPYHKPDSLYRAGLDFFLDRSTCTYSNVNSADGYGPDTTVTIFKLVNFINPNDQQLHNWHIGDIFEGYHLVEGYYTTSYINYILDTVSHISVSGHAATYTLSDMHFTCTSYPDICTMFSSYYWDPCSLIVNGGLYTFYDTVYSIANPSLIPEENTRMPAYVFYFPNDTTFCQTTPAYILTYADYSLISEETAWPIYYKLGIGRTYNVSWDEDCIIWFYDRLTYADMQGNNCGMLHPVEVNNVSPKNNALSIFPNPATTSLTITSSDKISNITFTNFLGQTLYNHEYTPSTSVQVDVSGLAVGVYFVKVNGADVRKFVKE